MSFAVDPNVIKGIARQIESYRAAAKTSRDRIQSVQIEASKGVAIAQVREAIEELVAVADSAGQLLGCIVQYLDTAAAKATETDQTMAGLISRTAK